MRLGPYVVSQEGFLTAARMLRTARSRPSRPRHEGTPAEIAAAVLRANAGEVLLAGACHFRAMWVADLGKAIVGTKRILPLPYLEGLTDRIIEASLERRRVPTTFTPTGAIDIPWPRADGAPWLLHIADQLGEDFASERREKLLTIYRSWLAATIDPSTGATRAGVRGDWVDTVRRPSSTYNLHCALHAHRLAERLEAPEAADLATRCEDHILRTRRLPDGAFIEDASGARVVAGDANALALYFQDLPRGDLEQAAAAIEGGPLVQPLPLRLRASSRSGRHVPTLARLAGSYHETLWAHLGWMWCIGLRRMGKPTAAHETVLLRSVKEQGTFLETLDENGKPFRSAFVASERDLTMSAGLFLEYEGLEKG